MSEEESREVCAHRLHRKAVVDVLGGIQPHWHRSGPHLIKYDRLEEHRGHSQRGQRHARPGLPTALPWPQPRVENYMDPSDSTRPTAGRHTGLTGSSRPFLSQELPSDRAPVKSETRLHMSPPENRVQRGGPLSSQLALSLPCALGEKVLAKMNDSREDRLTPTEGTQPWKKTRARQRQSSPREKGSRSRPETCPSPFYSPRQGPCHSPPAPATLTVPSGGNTSNLKRLSLLSNFPPPPELK